MIKPSLRGSQAVPNPENPVQKVSQIEIPTPGTPQIGNPRLPGTPELVQRAFWGVISHFRRFRRPWEGQK